MPGPAVQKLPRTAIPLPLAAIAEFCAKWKVKESAVFGSVLREDFRADSDVDVMVEFEPEATPDFSNFMKMQEELEFLLGRRVDLVTRESVTRSINWYRRKVILESARTIHAS